MTDENPMREAAREILVQMPFLPPAVLAVVYLDGSERIVAIALLAVAAYMAVDAVRGRFGSPVRASKITMSLVSNAVFVGLMATVILIGMRLHG